MTLAPRRLLLSIDRPAGTTMVSGTNGKTTTATLLAAAMGSQGRVRTNTTGSNLLSGLYNVLLDACDGDLVVLEVDEAVLPRAMAEIGADRLVLLNLSRDQLDRNHEVRRMALAWRVAIARRPGLHVIANADDPLAVWAALPATVVTWVAAGQRWRHDATLCPSCDASLTYGATEWCCEDCDFRRPAPTYVIDGHDLRATNTGRRWPIECALPGPANLGNAAMAMVAAMDAGCEPADIVTRWRGITSVAGRYAHHAVDGHDVRLILAKNPAGWQEMLGELRPDATLVVALNAQPVDGEDPSWIWDVPFEALQGRQVACAGQRALDLAVRMDYADVAHGAHANGLDAVRSLEPGPVDFIGDYSSFTELRRQLHGSLHA